MDAAIFPIQLSDVDEIEISSSVYYNIKRFSNLK